MRNILISVALVSAAALSVPAAAQFQDFGRGGYSQGAVQSIQAQVRQLHQRIDRMYQRRLISNREMR